MSRLAWIPWLFGVALMAYFLAVDAVIQIAVVTAGSAKHAFRAGYESARRLSR